MKNYKEVKGFFFAENTPQEVCDAIVKAYEQKLKVRIYMGDVKTGRTWNKEHDITGTVGRSTGSIKVPLLIATSRSMGGGEIMTDCILRIRFANGYGFGMDLYRADNYVQSTFKIIELSEYPQFAQGGYTHGVIINGEFYSRHRTERAAKMLVSKLS